MENELILKSRTEIKEKPRLEEPKLYKVIIHNDNYTTMDFVVEVIVKVFHKVSSEATQIMLEVHNKGRGIAGIYPYDIAVTKVNEVHQLARQREFPLRCSVEEA
ncbi:MAG: ATP-dependent Clp protease adaptor ClpS [Brevinematia bacterium]